jgi:hypothetical protein
MSGKDDPLGQSRPAPRALWLGKENMVEARDNFWKAFLDTRPDLVGHSDDTTAHAVWDIAWAAAIAAFSYVMEGRTEP